MDHFREGAADGSRGSSKHPNSGPVPAFGCWLVVLAAAFIVMPLWPTDAIRAADDAEFIAIALPGGEGGIGFDDFGFSSSLQKVLVPAGRTGTLDLIDPETRQVSSIRGFASSSQFGGGHGEGITSVDEGRGFLFVTDRTTKLLHVVDPKTRSVVASTRVASGPDYVRFVAETNEIWVTQPGVQRIEVFTLPGRGTPIPEHMRFIAVPGGPESLIIDHSNAVAYTHLWRGITVAIQLKDHSILARWPNGCEGSRGIALDEKRGFVFAACDEGRLSVLDSNTGKVLGKAVSGNGVDIIAYNRKLGHAYLPGEESATMAIIGISSAGSATVLKTIQTARGAHCATADDRDQVYVCDPSKGQLLLFKDAPAQARRD
jgi:DNA-binding beta-propeller fold protein YncE